MSDIRDLDLTGECALAEPFSFIDLQGFEVEAEDRVQSECKDKPPCGNGCGRADGSVGTCAGGVTSAASDCSVATAGRPDEGDAG